MLAKEAHPAAAPAPVAPQQRSKAASTAAGMDKTMVAILVASALLNLILLVVLLAG